MDTRKSRMNNLRLSIFELLYVTMLTVDTSHMRHE